MNLYLKNTQTGKVRPFGSDPDDALIISPNGKTLSFYSKKTNDDSGYLLCANKEGILPEDEWKMENRIIHEGGSGFVKRDNNISDVILVGTLNNLVAMYAANGIRAASDIKNNELFFGLEYDKTREKVNGSWHEYPLINGRDGKEYNEIFTGYKFTVAWSDDIEDMATIDNPLITCDKGDEISFIIGKNGWYC